MLDSYKILTVTHKALNTEDLQYFIVRHDGDEELIAQLSKLKEDFGQKEILYLSTCNRIIFFMFGERSLGPADIKAFFTKINPSLSTQQSIQLARAVKYQQGLAAIHHLYEVAASIDSLVVGEREIFRQYRAAYDFAHRQRLSGDNIRLANQSIVKAAKDVYTNTGIGAKPVSVVSLAIQEFLKRELPKDARIMLLGSGETNSTVGRFLKKHGYKNLLIYNRSLDNAKHLSEELQAEARYLGDLPLYNESWSAIFACTAAQDPILDLALFEQIHDARPGKVLIDLAIPQNISLEVASLPDVDYISIDSIRSLADENIRFRSSNIAAARMILNTHLKEFGLLYERRKIERAMSDLPDEIQKVRDKAIEIVYKDRIKALAPEAQELILEITGYMEKKCVAVPMKLAKKMVTE